MEGKQFIDLRDRVLQPGLSPDAARGAFEHAPFKSFNWARDYFDRIAAGNDRPALRVVDDAGLDLTLSYSEFSRRSHQVANFLAAHGVRPGDRVLIMLGNVVPLWEVMLAAIMLGAVIIPATTLLQRAISTTASRVAGSGRRHRASSTGHFDGLAGAPMRIAVGGAAPGWIDFATATLRRRWHLPVRRRRAPTS